MGISLSREVELDLHSWLVVIGLVCSRAAARGVAWPSHAPSADVALLRAAMLCRYCLSYVPFAQAMVMKAFGREVVEG